MLLLLATKLLCEFGYFVGTRKTCFINLTLQVSRFKTFSEHLVIFSRARNLKEGFTCLTKFMRLRSPWYSPQDRDFIVLFLSSRRLSLTLKKEDNKKRDPSLSRVWPNPSLDQFAMVIKRSQNFVYFRIMIFIKGTDDKIFEKKIAQHILPLCRYFTGLFLRATN